jgi:uncharacterized protein (DUF4415 family)
MNVKHMAKRSPATAPTDRTDWSKFDAQTDEEIAAAVRSDPDAAPLITPAWLDRARVLRPPEKEPISIRLDKDVLEHFRAQPRWQTRINAILRLVMAEDKATDQAR